MRVKLFAAVVLLILLSIGSNAAANGREYRQNTVIIKFDQGSEIFRNELADGKLNYLPRLAKILGNHEMRRLLSDESLKSYYKKLRGKGTALTQSQPDRYNLGMIFKVNYRSSIDPLLASRKISAIQGVVYAEPDYIRHFDSLPNDPGVQYQYYLSNIKAFEAWDSLQTEDSVLVGIVDTGVDWLHPDLAANIFMNQGEAGTDSLGNDKRSNGIDDDGNGYIDDWHGWDFVSSTGPQNQDNDPMPGNAHGTHVAGITAAVINNGVGIAGVAKNARIMPVKVGGDNASENSVYNSYEGLLYAASNGAQVINCSWGSSTKSLSEQDIVASCQALGAVIVAAAGNDNSEVRFYPAAYPGVLSVAAVDNYDSKASFSNYHPSVDVSAPGVNIYSTVPDSSYLTMSGTSMASPVATGVTALARLRLKDYTPIQIVEHVKSTSDNIDSINPWYPGKLGRGRVNALKTVTMSGVKSVIMTDYTITDQNNDKIIEENELVEIRAKFQNILAPTGNVSIEAEVLSNYKPEFTRNGIQLGSFQTMEMKEMPESIIFRVPADVPLDYNMDIKLNITDDEGYKGYEYVTITMRPSYRTMKSNNLSVTFNSRGNIAYNDYPYNLQGDGFSSRNSNNFLFEGALMIGASYRRMSDVARSGYQEVQNRAFIPEKLFKVDSSALPKLVTGNAIYRDSNDSLEAGVRVIQNVYQFCEPADSDLIIVSYDIINQSGAFIDSLAAGLYFDWDIGPSGSNNKVFFNNDESFAFVKNVYDATLPQVGMLLLSDLPMDFWAIDNDGNTDDNPGVWDGFTRREKWKMITSGIARKESNVTDVSAVIGAGPMTMRPGDTVRVAFSFFTGYDIDALRKGAARSRTLARDNNIANGSYSSLPRKDSITKLYPNPVENDILNIEFAVATTSNITLELFNSTGQIARTWIDNSMMRQGYYLRQFSTEGLSQGRYFIRLKTDSRIIAEPINILR